MKTIRRIEMTQRGFAFTELLVVLAVLAVLAAVLLPVFARAREKAREGVCTSNLRQIGIGMSMYAADNSQLLPPYDTDAQEETVSGKQKLLPAQSLELLACLHPYVRTNAVWHCPDDNPSHTPLSNGVFERHDTSYTYLGRYRKLVPGMLSEDFAVDNVGVADMGLVDELCSPNEPGATWGDYSHSGRSNNLYEDGHVRTLPIHSSTYDYPNPW